MQRAAAWVVWVWTAAAACATAGAPQAVAAQAPLPAQSATSTATDAQQSAPASSAEVVSAGGKLHGVAKSGNIPLPGVTVTAQNTLTGKRYTTTTDITGAWSLTIPQNGRYVIRTQFAGFAAGSVGSII